ncbi:MAG: monovalent cation:proton antiporter-2 (CPA2) family protein [Burkholderiales bacterium]|nr:monovalent cation:proton antiporter-2 (CPA2) family protein [Burkholderiales bacterium]
MRRGFHYDPGAMEHGSALLVQSVVFLGSAVLAVVVSHRLGLGAVAGYLLAGIAIGPFGLRLVERVEDVRPLAELGVVFLLFVIGLELEPRRLWQMRVRLATLGISQVVGSIALIVAAAWALGVDLQVGLVAGMALALSSTALALAPLTERGALRTQGGQAAFAILLFQDIAVIPMLAALALLGTGGSTASFSASAVAFAAAVIAATLVGGHFLARPVFRYIARLRQREIFTAFALALVLGIAWGFESAGLSMALGTFLAGVLLAESEYRHEIEAAVEPFKGLLLGLFFITVGMGVDFAQLAARPLAILGLIVGLFALKSAVLWAIARAANLPPDERPLFVLLLAQGGEFAFVILTLAVQQGVMPAPTAQAITLAVALSMLATPLLLVFHDRVLAPRFAPVEARAAERPEPAKVIIAGLGRVGQVVARLLHASGYEPTILDDDPDHVEQCRRFGFRVFYGDATRLDLLQAAGAAEADFLVIALDDPAATTRLARTAIRHFPNLKIIARARDMRHLFELRDLGVEIIERETFESALELGRAALAAVSGDPERAKRAARSFARHDEEVLAKLYEVHRSAPDAHVSVSNELRDQFARTLREDEAAIAAQAKARQGDTG